MNNKKSIYRTALTFQVALIAILVCCVAAFVGCPPVEEMTEDVTQPGTMTPATPATPVTPVTPKPGEDPPPDDDDGGTLPPDGGGGGTLPPDDPDEGGGGDLP